MQTFETMFATLAEPVETMSSFSYMKYKDVVREALAAEENFVNQMQQITLVSGVAQRFRLSFFRWRPFQSQE